MEDKNNISVNNLIEGYITVIDQAFIPNGMDLKTELGYLKNLGTFIIDSSKVCDKCSCDAIRLIRLDPVQKEEKTYIVEGIEGMEGLS